jgi:hypothetical protein
LVVFGTLLDFFDFLTDNGVEWIEFKNLFESSAGQIILNFINLNLNFNLEGVRRWFGVQCGLVH